MEYAFAFAVVVIVYLVVDRVALTRRFDAFVDTAFKQGDAAHAYHERLTRLHAQERRETDRRAERERAILLARETNAEMADGAAVAQAMADHYAEQGQVKLHVSPDDDEGWASLLREQREAMERDVIG